MKKWYRMLLSMTLCAALLCLPALATAEGDEADMGPDYLAPVRVWGTVTRLENGSLFLKNSDENDPNREIVVHLGDAPVVDAVSGLPLEASSIEDGDTVYAWVGPAMTLSLPPQASATVVVANIPADFAVPEYYEITGGDHTAVIAMYPAPPRTAVNLPYAGGGKADLLCIPVTAQISPWLTKQIVTVDDLVPGTRILAWRGADGEISRVQMLRSAYRGYILANGAAIHTVVNGETLAVNGKSQYNQVLLPVRAVAEAAGCTVTWEAGRGAVVSRGGQLVFSVLPGAETARTADDEWTLTRPCEIENGVTYLRAEDLAHLLDLFLSLDA